MTGFNSATCRQCGAEFSPPLMGGTSDLCPQCRQNAQPSPEPRRRAPRPAISELIRMFPATSILVGLNVLVYIAMVVKGVSPATPTTADLLRWGADFGPLSLGGESWRLLTSCFVHAGFLHLLFNMWCLWTLGLFVERFLGRASYVIAYLLAGLGGAVASVWWHPMVVGVGASGAIFGLAGIMVPLLRSGRLSLPAEYLKHHSKSILAFIGYNLLFGFISPHIDNSAHLGGLITGLFLGALLPVADSEHGGSRRLVAFGACALIVFGGFAYARSSSGATMAFAAGEQAFESGQWNKASAAFEAATRAGARQPEVYRKLGNAYLMSGKYAKAVPPLQKATELAPTDANAFGNLGVAYMRLGNFESGEKALRRATHLDPKNPRIWYDLALCYAGERRIDAATQAANTALQLDPKNADAQQLLERLRQAPSSQPQ